MTPTQKVKYKAADNTVIRNQYKHVLAVCFKALGRATLMQSILNPISTFSAPSAKAQLWWVKLMLARFIVLLSFSRYNPPQKREPRSALGAWPTRQGWL